MYVKSSPFQENHILQNEAFNFTRSSGHYAPFLLAPAEGWGEGSLWGPPRVPPNIFGAINPYTII